MKTNYDSLHSMTLDELAQWLYKHVNPDDAPWMEWFDKTYCKKCESLELSSKEAVSILDFDPWYYHGTVTCGYCEVKGKCRFFSELDYIPLCEDIIRMWLESEADKEGDY